MSDTSIVTIIAIASIVCIVVVSQVVNGVRASLYKLDGRFDRHLEAELQEDKKHAAQIESMERELNDLRHGLREVESSINNIKNEVGDAVRYYHNTKAIT